jgi:hypothetical protein
MKHKSLRALSAASIVMVSLACSVFTRFTRPEATPTSDYIFTPSTIMLKIEPDILPDAQADVEYEVDLRVSDNVTPVDIVSISKGTLPAGLELVFVDHVDGAKIIGTPEETGTFTFTVFVACKAAMVVGQTLEKEFQIVVEN